MMVGNRYYSEADMLRMQRDAEERVREMQNRARRTAEEAGSGNTAGSSSRNRNWNTGSAQRRPPRGGQNPGQYHQAPEAQRSSQNPGQYRQEPEPQRTGGPVTPESAPDAPQKKTTIIEDIMSALNMDEDYLLIIGLILILANQRADTTLILALAYLLI